MRARLVLCTLALALAGCGGNQYHSSPAPSPALRLSPEPQRLLVDCRPQSDTMPALSCRRTDPTGGRIRVAWNPSRNCVYEPEGWDADDLRWVPVGKTACRT